MSEELDRPYLWMLEEVVFQPVFIMGDHRSGTTVLYEMLGASGCFNIVTAYHILKRHEILHHHVNGTLDECKRQLNLQFQQSGLTDRGIDEVAANAETPEEYGFALQPSGYRPQLNPGNLPSFVTFCKSVQLTSDPTLPLLLKNPWDVLNFIYVKQAFPESKLVFIHRHPIDTISSQLTATRALLDSRNEYVALIVPWYRRLWHQPLRRNLTRLLFSAHLDLGLRVTTRHVARAADYFMVHVSALPQGDFFGVRYEDLCREPGATIGRVLQWLGQKEKAAVDYAALIKPRHGPLLSKVEKNKAAIYRRMKAYYEYWGYGLDGA